MPVCSPQCCLLSLQADDFDEAWPQLLTYPQVPALAYFGTGSCAPSVPSATSTVSAPLSQSPWPARQLLFALRHTGLVQCCICSVMPPATDHLELCSRHMGDQAHIQSSLFVPSPHTGTSSSRANPAWKCVDAIWSVGNCCFC